MEASSFVKEIEDKKEIMIGCLEEIAFKNSWITHEMLLKKINLQSHNRYGKYLDKILDKI